MRIVILSAVGTSRSEVPTKSKDPYVLPVSGDAQKFCPASREHRDNTRLPGRTGYFFPKNFPTPSAPAPYSLPDSARSARHSKYACTGHPPTTHAHPRKYIPTPRPDVKFIVEVPAGTSCAVNSVPPLNSR